MSKSESVVIESIEVRELLRFLFYLDILNKLSLLQRKHSKYMYAKCLNFPCFITYLAARMHAFYMFYLYVLLGNSSAKRFWVFSYSSFSCIMLRFYVHFFHFLSFQWPINLLINHLLFFAPYLKINKKYSIGKYERFLSFYFSDKFCQFYYRWKKNEK